MSRLLRLPGMQPSTLQDVFGQSLGVRALLTVLPFAIISDAVNLVVDSDGATLVDTFSSAPLDALPEHVDTPLAIIGTDTVIQFGKVDTVLEGTILDQILGWNLGIVAR